MLSVQSTALHSRFLQPWQPASRTRSDHSGSQADYIELPAVSNYQDLEDHSAFQSIKGQFLNDIKALKQLAQVYVNQQYDKAIDTFYNKLDDPPERLRGCLFPLYRETRFQMHRLVSQLKHDQQADGQSPHDSDQNAASEDYIASVLHDCLNGIDLCPGGVHSRFTHSFLDLEAAREGLPGKLFKVRSDLFTEFIQSFLFQQQREGLINLPADMEVHWSNSFHNLYCDPLALASVEDPMAPKNLGDDVTHRFLSAAPLHINECTILRKITDEWSDQLTEILQQQGVSAWQTDSIAATEITAERVEALDNRVFKRVNRLLGITGDNPLDLWSVIETKDDGNTYRLDRYREKLLAWVTNEFYGSRTTVLAAIPCKGETTQCIGTINHLFFWVFGSDQSTGTGQACTFETDNHVTLQLPHLASIDFSTWPDTTCHALLTQAMAQTNKAEDIASFFLKPCSRRQLTNAKRPIVEALSNQLTEKLVNRNNGSFRETLCKCVCDHLVGSGMETVQPETLNWLINTPLLQPVLSELHQPGMDTGEVTEILTSWQISDFSGDSIIKLLKPQDCQRLFKQAVRLEQAETMSRLLLTGHCDQLINSLNDKQEMPLGIVARLGVLPGLSYVLKKNNTAVNHKDTYGCTPLSSAARYGHLECVRELLTASTIQVNEKNNYGWTPLNRAARQGHWECVRELQTASTIQVNEKNNSGFSPLNSAARQGRWECVRELQTASTIQVNEKNNSGFSPLNSAARYGHWKCVRELLTVSTIQVNEKNNDGWTPLNSAAREGHWKCVRELQTASTIQVNEKNNSGFSPLNSAAGEGHWECVRELLTASTIQVNEKNNDGWTPLNSAAREGHFECVRELLAVSTIQVNEKNNDGFLPLSSAAREGHWKCVRELLTASTIQVNERSNDGWSPLNSAAREGHWECVRELLTASTIQVNEKSNDGWTPLNSAAREGRFECVRELLAASTVQVNEKNNNGFLPLSSAARLGHWKCVRELLTASTIQVNERSNDGCTPLHLSARYGHWECVRELLTASTIQVNERSNDGWTPLHSSARYGHWGCVRELLTASTIQVNERSNDGWTPLHSSARYGHWECVRELLTASTIQVNERSNNGWTPLHSSARYGHWECVRELLQHRSIQINKRNPYMLNTALTLAIKFKHTECATLLINDDRTDVNKVSLSLNTALSKARRKGLTEIVDLLGDDQRLSKPLDRLMKVLRR